MRFLLLVCLLGLALAFDLSLFIASSDDAFDPFDPLHPATLLSIVAGRLHEIQSQVREFDAQHLFDVLAAPYRARLQRPLPTEPLPQ
jgi:hypothetical protein